MSALQQGMLIGLVYVSCAYALWFLVLWLIKRGGDQ